MKNADSKENLWYGVNKTLINEGGEAILAKPYQ